MLHVHRYRCIAGYGSPAKGYCCRLLPHLHQHVSALGNPLLQLRGAAAGGAHHLQRERLQGALQVSGKAVGAYTATPKCAMGKRCPPPQPTACHRPTSCFTKVPALGCEGKMTRYPFFLGLGPFAVPFCYSCAHGPFPTCSRARNPPPPPAAPPSTSCPAASSSRGGCEEARARMALRTRDGGRKLA